MAYPRNAATPPIVTVGQVVQSSDGAIQTTGASVRVKTGTGSWAAGSGTLACDATSGAWTYAPTQGETDAESFQVAVYKASCIGATIGVVTSALLDRLTSTRAGYLDNLSGGAVALASGVNVVQIGGQTVTAAASITVGAYVGGTGAAALEATAQTILTDTNELQTDWANGGRLDVILDARASQSSVDTIDGIVDDILTDTGTTIPTQLTNMSGATFDTSTDSLEALRNRGDSAWITATGFSTLDAAGVRAAVGMSSANLDAQIAALPTASENADAVYEEPYSEHDSAGTYGKLFDILRKANYVTDGTVAAGGTPTTTVFRTNLSAVSGQYDHQTLLFVSGSLTGQSKPVESFSATNGEITLGEALTSAPTAGDEFVLLPDHVHSLEGIADMVLGRSVATVEGTAGEHSLTTIVLAILESSVSGSTWTIKRTDGSTTHFTKTITTDAAADPITGVS